MLNFLRRLLRGIFTLLVALVLLFEEWGWEPLAALIAWVAKLPLLRQIETLIRDLSPWAALATFLIPTLTLLPVKLFAVYLFGSGHATLGLLLLLSAKLVGTAILARLFQLTQPALMRLTWFARLYLRWKHWKDELLQQVRASALWRMGQKFKANAKATVARWLKGISGQP